jgi:ferredoxin-NADP reductase
MAHIIKINNIQNLTHNVKRFTCEKPANYSFVSGQATEVAINKSGWQTEKRPFTFTSLSQSPDLEFTIKIYKDHPGVTNELDSLKVGDELIVEDVWGTIAYNGPGYFIAGGAGITPFISILRQLKHNNELDGNQEFYHRITTVADGNYVPVGQPAF